MPKNTALVDTLTVVAQQPLTPDAFAAHFGALADVLYREIILEQYVTLDREGHLILTPYGQILLRAAPEPPAAGPPP